MLLWAGAVPVSLRSSQRSLCRPSRKQLYSEASLVGQFFISCHVGTPKACQGLHTSAPAIGVGTRKASVSAGTPLLTHMPGKLPPSPPHPLGGWVVWVEVTGSHSPPSGTVCMVQFPLSRSSGPRLRPDSSQHTSIPPLPCPHLPLHSLPVLLGGYPPQPLTFTSSPQAPRSKVSHSGAGCECPPSRNANFGLKDFRVLM